MIDRYLGIYAHPTALIFCVTTQHAKDVAQFLKTKNLRAEFLTSENHQQRNVILEDFKRGRINYLCVVNMFNEGIDVPEINTIILLRPTNSKTIYLQQLGRGLRKTPLKSRLEVYDLIANIDQRYDLTMGLKNLLNPDLSVKDFLENNQGLPYDSTLFLEKRSEALILNNLKRWYEDRSRIKNNIYEYYQKYHQDSLAKLLIDYEMNLMTFYDHLNDLMIKAAKGIKIFHPFENDTSRNKNLVKQFIFLDNYEIIKYFYDRLSKKINPTEIN
jgi:superfamily II DNA or RNA helicase